MKTKFLMTAIVSSLLFFSACDSTMELNNEDQGAQKSLKVSLNEGVGDLTKAVNLISGSDEFRLLGNISLANQQNVSGAQYAPEFRNDSVRILLADISGVYEYSWKRVKRAPMSILRYFERTADNDHLIVRLPVQKVRDYFYLFVHRPNDTTLTNNFEADVHDYMLFRSHEKGLEYRLGANLKFDSTNIGAITIRSTRNKVNGFDYLSVYHLGNGYTVSNVENSGDTAVSVYSINKDDKILYEENISSYRVNKENRRRERVYSLTIGDVKIVREMGPNSLDSAKVYVAGVLQLNSKVEVVINETEGSEPGVTNKKRDVKITFDDGTSTTIRELTGNTIENIAEIFKAVRQAGFATQIIDRIAGNIYWNKN
ncbi:MAG: hypothetical protein VB102_11915 [Paludibacter sp.]|nr:hypothetical protein [Paludibacter sp.]